MGLVDPIRSPGNARLKAARAVTAGRDRDHLLLEGDHLLGEALSAGIPLEWVLFDTASGSDGRSALLERAEAAGAEVVPCDGALMHAASHLTTPPGVIAWGARPDLSLATVLAAASPSHPLLVSAGVQEPGNVGALVRVAAGLGAAGFIALRGGASPWQPKALRGSSGTAFRLPVVDRVDPAKFLSAARAAGVACWAANSGGSDCRALTTSHPIALILGEEGRGIDADLMAACEQTVGIVLHRGVESLNVATAAAVLLHSLAGGVQE